MPGAPPVAPGKPPDIDQGRAILNVAGMGQFSSDRTIQEYATNVWGVQAVRG